MATAKTAAAGKQPKKKAKKNVATGIAHIQSTFINTTVTITDINGNTISWSSSGSRGFKGSRKSTPFAAQLAAEEAARRAMEHGMRSVAVFVTSLGSGRHLFSGEAAAARAKELASGGADYRAVLLKLQDRS